MRAIAISFEIIYHAIEKPSVGGLPPEYVQESLDVRDLIVTSIESGLVLLVYYNNKISDDWADLYARKIRKYYNIEIPPINEPERVDFLFVPQSDLAVGLDKLGIGTASTFLICTDDFDDSSVYNMGFTDYLRIGTNNFSDLRELSIQLNPGILIETLELSLVGDLLDLLIQLDAKSANYFLLYDLELILQGSSTRNQALLVIKEHLEEIIRPPLSRIFIDGTTNDIIWLDYTSKENPLEPATLNLNASLLTFFIFFNCTEVKEIRIADLIDHLDEFADIRMKLSPAIGKIAALNAFKPILQLGGGGVPARLGLIRKAIKDTIGFPSIYYTIEGIPGEAFGTYIRRNYLEKIDCNLKDL